MQSPAGKYTVNADGSVTLTDAGWYQVQAEVWISGNFDGVLYATLGNQANAEGVYASAAGRGSASSKPAVQVVVLALSLPAGARLYINAWAQAGANAYIRTFSMARVQ
jgi:hypothetical protein